MDDLNALVEVIDEVIKSIPHNHPDQAGHLNNLGNALRIRFERTVSMDDLIAAVEANEKVVKSTLVERNSGGLPSNMARRVPISGLNSARMET